ncbi:MAG TPA: SGNH/GDSL hydrolase family protein [Scandinavium sp.]|jgi:lysophospholipase L1-like esterase|uniref:SGNH/GDSL hydrolase family protein n=1 Tax=Scandinavium sp. TaxID=2830653 RepID=UPI002E368436|nr:SGNH/GDSL hydrolase family protein [Scandinavium sp.]HEX4501763.1 SGNH/GDSL hydrolase family protein [Scandinavium sp.]
MRLLAVFTALTALLIFPFAHAEPISRNGWVASWTASPQAIWGKDFAFPTNIPAVIEGQTLRQVARISLGGKKVRLVFSNAYGKQPLKIGAATVAVTDKASSMQTATLKTVTFSGETSATIPPGAPLLSDPLDLPVNALSHMTVSTFLPDNTPTTTFHWDARQTAWLAAGNQVSAPTLTSATAMTTRTLLTGIEVQTAQPEPQAIAVIGDSITDGDGVSVDSDARWPDFLAQRLAPKGIAVINAGISGGRLLSDQMGDNAVARFARDVLDQPGVRTAIVLIGINDISWSGTIFAPDAPLPTLESLQMGYRQLVAQAHRRGVRIIGVTLTPFEGALHDSPVHGYYTADKDALRQKLNAWIRDSGTFDAVIDFDKYAADPAHPLRLAPAIDSGDSLHPGDAGNRMLAEKIPLEVLMSSGK